MRQMDQSNESEFELVVQIESDIELVVWQAVWAVLPGIAHAITVGLRNIEMSRQNKRTEQIMSQIIPDAPRLPFQPPLHPVDSDHANKASFL